VQQISLAWRDVCESECDGTCAYVRDRRRGREGEVVVVAVVEWSGVKQEEENRGRGGLK
jgi:hypothetical protein